MRYLQIWACMINRPRPPTRALTLCVASRYGMHVVVGNELHSRYDKVELVFPGGDERQIKKGKGAGVRQERGGESCLLSALVKGRVFCV